MSAVLVYSFKVMVNSMLMNYSYETGFFAVKLLGQNIIVNSPLMN